MPKNEPSYFSENLFCIYPVYFVRPNKYLLKNNTYTFTRDVSWHNRFDWYDVYIM